MNISDLRTGQQGVDIECAELISKGEAKDVTSKYGKRLRVANCVIQDETGSISLSLWGDDIDKVAVGDQLRITNAFVKDFRGSPALNLTREGSVETLK